MEVNHMFSWVTHYVMTAMGTWSVMCIIYICGGSKCMQQTSANGMNPEEQSITQLKIEDHQIVNDYSQNYKLCQNTCMQQKKRFWTKGGLSFNCSVCAHRRIEALWESNIEQTWACLAARAATILVTSLAAASSIMRFATIGSEGPKKEPKLHNMTQRN